MKNNICLFGFLVAIAVLTGCATTPPQSSVAFSSSEIVDGDTVGIYIDELPATGMNYPGAACLLCLATAAAANSGLSGYSKTLSNEELGDDFAKEIYKQFESDGIKSTVLQGEMDLSKLKKASYENDRQARKDYTSIANVVENSHLLVIDIDYSGFGRQYANYLATSPPYVLISGKACLLYTSDAADE